MCLCADASTPAFVFATCAMLIHSYSSLSSVPCLLASASSLLSLFLKSNVGVHQGRKRQHTHREEEASQVQQQARQAEAGGEDLAQDLVQPQVPVPHSTPIPSLANVCVEPRHGLRFAYCQQGLRV